MRALLQSGEVLSADTPVTVPTAGIVDRHAYAVRDVYTLNGAWRVRLYNPWGVDGPVLVDPPRDARQDGWVDLSWDLFAANFEGITWSAW
jgi:hypothetical protein